MSLSEPRKRRKNQMHSINLSAQNHWSNDDSKFGQKMLEKFGWSKGSGLGKNEQGISENIKVQHKVIPTGLGFVAHNADDWFKAGEDYSRLLSQLTEKFDQYKALSEDTDDMTSKKSLVQNSLNSKSRVHYHKFTKGKDLTQYKKDELACILGKGVKSDDQSLNGLNMQEYFKLKRESKNLPKNKYDLSSNENSVVSIDDDTNERITVKKENDEHEINIIPIKKKKNDSKLFKDTELVESNECDDIQIKVKKKKSKALSDNVVDFVEKSKKKKSKKLSAQDAFIVEVSQNKKSNGIVSEHIDNTELKKKKKSKIIASEDLDNVKSHTSECNSDSKITEKEQESESELVLTHKYKNLVDLLVENSSAGIKYCKDSPSPFFETRMKKFADGVKLQCATTVSSNEVKPIDADPIDIQPLILDPNDANFIKDFEAQKSKVLENIMKKQEVSKYINEKSMFIAKHGDVLFFGSNINDIKGYGNW